MSTRRAGGRSRSKSRSRRDEEDSGSEPEPAPSPARLACSEESLVEQEALLATEYAPFVEERYPWPAKLIAREAARFRTAHLTGVQPEALVFPAEGVA